MVIYYICVKIFFCVKGYLVVVVVVYCVGLLFVDECMGVWYDYFCRGGVVESCWVVFLKVFDWLFDVVSFW